MYIIHEDHIWGTKFKQCTSIYESYEPKCVWLFVRMDGNIYNLEKDLNNENSNSDSG